jgi:hypothetical protein
MGMNKSSPKGLKLSTVAFVVGVLAVFALLSNNSIADDMDVYINMSE